MYLPNMIPTYTKYEVYIPYMVFHVNNGGCTQTESLFTNTLPRPYFHTNMVSYTDGEKIKAIWEEVSRGGETNWLALKYVDKEQFDISGSGSGGYEEFLAHLPEDDIIFGGFRVYGLNEEGENPRTKLIAVSYVPSGVKGLKRARAGPHKGEVLKAFHGFHISVEAVSKDDLATEELEKKLNESTGSHKPASYTWKQ